MPTQVKEVKQVGWSYSPTVQGVVTEVYKVNHLKEVSQNFYVKGIGLVVIGPGGFTPSGPMALFDGSRMQIASGPGSTRRASPGSRTSTAGAAA
jgi:hypothetical protein